MFKSVLTGKICRVSWEKDGTAWVTSSDSKFGSIGKIDQWRQFATTTTAKPGKMTHSYEVGDRFMYGQSYHCEIIAVAEKAVLILRDGDSWPYAEQADAIGEKYQREARKVNLF